MIEETIPLYETFKSPELSTGSPYWSTTRTPLMPWALALYKSMASSTLNLHFFDLLLDFLFDRAATDVDLLVRLVGV